MAASGSPARLPHWSWAVALVGSLHLSTSAGTWLVSDHAEMLFMSRQLLRHGTLTLAPAGGRLPELPWIPLARDGPTRSRLFPGTPVAMAPFVAADRVLGWDDPKNFGWVAHLGGHVYVLAALALIGAAVSLAAGPQAAAAAVVLGGSSWPVWQISRHGGAEPVVGALLALFVWASPSPGRPVLQATACALLPWVHPTGFLLSPVLAVTPALEAALAWPREPFPGARTRLLLTASVVSLAGVVLLWNGLYHGNLLGGGYANQGVHKEFFSASPLGAALYSLRESLWLAPLPVALALIGAVARGRDGARLLVLPVLAYAAFLALFAAFTMSSGQEPARRFSVVWLAWAAAAGAGWDRLPLKGAAALGLLGLSLGIGVYYLLLRESHYYPRGDGLFDPLVVWLTLAREGRPAWQYVVPLAGITGVGLVAAGNLATLLRSSAAGR